MADEWDLPLLDRTPAADQTLTVRFDTSRHNIRYKPGDAADIRVLDPIHKAKHLVHTYTLSSSPSEEGFVQITTRMRDTPFKRNLRDVPLGHLFRFKRPGGKFHLPQDSKTPLVFIAGGIGVTPFRSMLRYLADTGQKRRVLLFTSDRAPAAMPFVEELRTMARTMPLALVRTVTAAPGPAWVGERGRIDAAMLRRHVAEPWWGSARFYVAGPPGMADGMHTILDEMGVPQRRRSVDEFAGY